MVPRQRLYDSYASRDIIYWRDEVPCYRCDKTSTTNIYSIDYNSVLEPPAESRIPIVAIHVNDDMLWMWNHFRHNALLHEPHEEYMALEDTFIEREGVEPSLVSDLSVHRERIQVEGFWHLFKD